MKIAVEGCCHGELDKIYETIAELERQDSVKVDLLLCCGDFQSVRNYHDMRSMAVPIKYQQLNTFYKYYSGECLAPILTIFIGGNHEASSFLAELPYGGWVAPNIFYLGYAGVVSVNGVRIAGVSGIYKGHDYLRGHFEISPFDDNTMRSTYHVRNLEIFRLKQLADDDVMSRVDIMMSHDWPTNIHKYGAHEDLFNEKPFFKDDAEKGVLGCRPTEELLKVLKPRYWFSAHLHCKFAALVPHQDSTSTKFLALDKCLPRRQFLQLIDIEPLKPVEESKYGFCYDPAWLAVLRSTDHLWNLKSTPSYMPGPGYEDRYNFKPTTEELGDILARFEDDLSIPSNFIYTAPLHDPEMPMRSAKQKPSYRNPQTAMFCSTLEILDVNAHFAKLDPVGTSILNELGSGDVTEETSDKIKNPDAIDLDDSDEEECLDDVKPMEAVEHQPDLEVKKPSFSLPPPKLACADGDNCLPTTHFASLVENVSEKINEFVSESRQEVKSEDDLADGKPDSRADSCANTEKPEQSPAQSSTMKKLKRRNAEFYEQSDDV